MESRGASSNGMGIICPLVGIGLTELPNSGDAKAPPLTTALLLHFLEKRVKHDQVIIDVYFVSICRPVARSENPGGHVVLWWV